MAKTGTKIRFCLDCRYELSDNAQFCPECGQKRGKNDDEVIKGAKKIYCPECGIVVLPDINGPFCYNCQKLVGTELSDNNVKQNRKVAIVRNQPSGALDPTSNYGIATDGIPLAVKHASFPVAIFFPIWLIAHRMGIWIVIMLIVMPIASALLILLIPIIGWIVAAFGNLWVYIHLIRRGNELAWRRGQYRNLDDFYARERKWINAAWWTILASIMAGCVLGFILGVIIPSIQGNNAARDMLHSLETH